MKEESFTHLLISSLLKFRRISLIRYLLKLSPLYFLHFLVKYVHCRKNLAFKRGIREYLHRKRYNFVCTVCCEISSTISSSSPFGIKMGTLYYATRYVMYVHGCIHTWSYIITDILYFTISYFIYGRRQQNSSLIQCLRKRDKRSFLRTHSKSNMKSGVKDNKNRFRWKLHHVVNKKTHGNSKSSLNAETDRKEICVNLRCLKISTVNAKG